MTKYELTADMTANRQYWKLMIKTGPQRNGDDSKCEKGEKKVNVWKKLFNPNGSYVVDIRLLSSIANGNY